VAVSTYTFAHAFIAALAGCVFIVLGGFLRVGFCLTMAVAIMVSGFGLHGFSAVMRHSMRDRRGKARGYHERQNHNDAN
jgi:hypothetical protein